MSLRFWRRYLSDPFALFGTLFLFILLICAIFAEQIAPFPPMKQDLLSQFQMPSNDHLLGTDEFGRDTLSRLIFGGRLMFQSILVAMAIAIGTGVPIGLFSGYIGGRFDRFVTWVIDVVFTLPSMMVAFAIVAILGTGLINAMVAVGIVFSTRFARLTRGIVLGERKELYVDGAVVGGLPMRVILFKHILPNILPPLIVQVAILAGTVILIESSLSFLGLGVHIGEPSWGSMLFEAQRQMRSYAFGVLPPGIAIVLTVLSFNLIADGIRDALGREDNQHQLSVRRNHYETRYVQPHNPDAMLSVRNLDVTFPGKHAPLRILNNVSFEIMPGETLGLVGESGSGKSMTALSILGLVPQPGQISNGAVAFLNDELTSKSERAFGAIRGKDIAIIFQEPWASLNPSIKIGRLLQEKIEHHLGLSSVESRQRALELLKLVHIPDPERRLDEYPHQLSGGMAQRVGIALALTCDPKLLIADEPTTALDVTVQGQILDLLQELQDKLGMAILLITHDLGVVAETCDRAAVMYAGEIVEIASTAALFSNPQHPYTRALLETLPHHSQDDRLPIIDGMVPPPSDWPTGCRFHPRCQFAAEACKSDVPWELNDMGDNHWNACIRSEDIYSTEVVPT